MEVDVSTRVVEIDATALTAADATVMVAEKLAEAIAEGGIFQAIVRMPRDTGRARDAQATRSVRLLKEVRPGLVEHCTGLAFVADDGHRDERRRGASVARRAQRRGGTMTCEASGSGRRSRWWMSHVTCWRAP
jgi:hypothetical protein